MRICQVVGSFPYQEHLEGNIANEKYHVGGVERHVFELSNALIKRGHSVSVLTSRSPSHKKNHEIEGMDVERLSSSISIFSGTIPFKVFTTLDPTKYDLIHAHTPNPAIADLACIKGNSKVPFILTYHNDIFMENTPGKIICSMYNNTLGNLLLKRSDLIITTTKSYADKSVHIKNFKNKIEVVPNGIPIERIDTSINENRIKEKYDLPIQSKIILYTGTLASYKGIEYLIEAFKKIVDYSKTSYLFIVGSGPLRKKLEDRVYTLGISDNVFFTGYVGDNDLLYYYKACDVFVLPSVSEKEGFGIVQLEAMAFKKPVVCTNMPGIKEVDEDEIATIHVPPRDPEALMNAIIKILRDDELSRKMGENGRKMVEQKYTWSKVAEKIEMIYKKMLTSFAFT